jgi:hypothetical protein
MWDVELLRKAAREVLIAVCVVDNAMMRRALLFVTKLAEVGVLMRALAECYRAATVAFGQTRNMTATKLGVGRDPRALRYF